MQPITKSLPNGQKSQGSRDERDRSLIAERYKAAHERKMEKLSKNLSGVVSPALRWTIFAMNVVFWLVGLLTILIGIWAFVQKTQKQKSRTIQGVLDVVTDIAIVFSILGFVVFSLSFAGCVGTLRQNIGLLRFFRYVLIIILGLQIIAIVCLIIFASVSVKYIQEFVKKTAIVQYTEDIDLQNIIDFIQLSLKCCGAGEDSYNDWNGNRYFNCTEDNPSTERCSLPFSCCMAPNDIDADIINTKCAYKVLKETTAQIQTVVWPFGCVSKIKSLVKRHAIYATIGVAVYILCYCLIIDVVDRLINQIKYLRQEWIKRYEKHDSFDAVSISDLVKKSYKQKMADRTVVERRVSTL